MSLRKAVAMLSPRVISMSPAQAVDFGNVMHLLGRDTGYDRRDAREALRRLAAVIPVEQREEYLAEIEGKQHGP